jgi:hypothetical protein
MEMEDESIPTTSRSEVEGLIRRLRKGTIGYDHHVPPLVFHKIVRINPLQLVDGLGRHANPKINHILG